MTKTSRKNCSDYRVYYTEVYKCLPPSLSSCVPVHSLAFHLHKNKIKDENTQFCWKSSHSLKVFNMEHCVFLILDMHTSCTFSRVQYMLVGAWPSWRQPVYHRRLSPLKKIEHVEQIWTFCFSATKFLLRFWNGYALYIPQVLFREP